MQYLGSKRRIAKYILPIILNGRLKDQYYVEPFMGGCNTLHLVGGNRIGADSNTYIVSMWDNLVNHKWIPPNEVSKVDYLHIKNNQFLYNKHLVGFVGVALSFGAKWFDSYAKNKKGTNYALSGRQNLLKQVKNLKGTQFKTSDFKDLQIPPESIIYCDPPYENTTKGYKSKFNHLQFWAWCREMSLFGHTVFVSEYNAPDDFKCIWSMPLNTTVNVTKPRSSIEKLFIFSPQHITSSINNNLEP